LEPAERQARTEESYHDNADTDDPESSALNPPQRQTETHDTPQPLIQLDSDESDDDFNPRALPS
jgi:hypothetical protein